MPGKNCVVPACAVGVISLACAGWAHASFTFDDIGYWVGSGANSAALVIDWNDGKSAESVAWGFRWDGVATGADMLEAIVRADDRLYAAIATFGFGDALIGLGYDTDNDGFQTAPATVFDADGWAVTGPRDGTAPADIDDHYVEGWNTGYWAYYLATGSPYDGSDAWAFASTGSSGRTLFDGAWDGLSFAPGFDGSEPGAPVGAQVPAPGVAVAVGFGVLASPRRRSR